MLDLDTITTDTHNITAVQVMLTYDLRGAYALDERGCPLAELETNGATLKEIALDLQTYMNTYVQDVTRDFIIDKVVEDEQTVTIVLAGKINRGEDLDGESEDTIWSEVIITSQPREVAHAHSH